MRRSVIAALLAVMLLALAASPAAAGKPAEKRETRAVIPVEPPPFGPVTNPCTGETTLLQIRFDFGLHALPSVDSYFSGDFTHANIKYTGQIVGVDDGYATEWKPFASEVINQRADHYVESVAENVMFFGDDGGQYRVRRPFKLVEVRGEVKVSFQADDAACVRQPAG